MSESVGERGESDTPGTDSEGERGRKEGEQMRVKESVGIAWESEGEGRFEPPRGRLQFLNEECPAWDERWMNESNALK